MMPLCGGTDFQHFPPLVSILRHIVVARENGRALAGIARS